MHFVQKVIQKIKFYKESDVRKGMVPKSYFKPFLPADPIIVEAGAAHGVDTVEMAKTWPSSVIYAFEPIPSIFSDLNKRTSSLTNIYTVPLALSNQTGTAQMFVSGGDSHYSSSLLEPKEHLNHHPTVSFNHTIQVSTITLDQWAIGNNISKVDLLWLDLQGSEPDVLRASPETLKTVKVIYSEVSLKQLYKGTPLYFEFRSWLETQGFRVEREELAWEDAGNVLFVRNH